jgi:hypothetical protein
MPRYGEKSTCYCGREIRWTGKFWEHTEGLFRHIAKPGGLTRAEPDAASRPADSEQERDAAQVSSDC